jgi:hypothetical protein
MSREKSASDARDGETPIAEDERNQPSGEVEWQNRGWAIVFLITLVGYLGLAGWMLYSVQQNSDAYLNINGDKLPGWIQMVKDQNKDSAPKARPPVDLYAS